MRFSFRILTKCSFVCLIRILICFLEKIFKKTNTKQLNLTRQLVKKLNARSLSIADQSFKM